MPTILRYLQSLAAGMALLLPWQAIPAQNGGSSDTLTKGFIEPPNSAKPRVWWHWMNGNVTEEGVKLDLEWMQRVGIGGVQNFDASLEWGGDFNTPQLVDKPIHYLTPEWRRAFRYSVGLANELGLEFTIASSAGWSQTGGPWVKPQQAMKKLVWSETLVQGGKPFKGRVPAPPATTGLFQNMPLIVVGPRGPWDNASHYVDIATLAYRAPAVETLSSDLQPSVTSSGGNIDASRLRDGDLAQGESLPFGDGPQSWIQLSFARPQRIQAVTAVIARPFALHPIRELGAKAWLEASVDGRTFEKITDLPRIGALAQTVTFAPAQARAFRLVVERRNTNRWERLASPNPPAAHSIAELVLHTAPRVHRFEDKAGFSFQQILASDDTPQVAVDELVRRQDVIDLTKRMRADGSLDWTPPPGRWIVQRFGYSLTGRINFSASRAGIGLEVDKLNRMHVKHYIDDYLREYEQALAAIPSSNKGWHGLQYLLIDSYEALSQNWTEDLLEQFKTRRGYDALAWLPVLTGRVLESATASDRFLWDFRATLAELMTDAHYGELDTAVRARGLKSYGESHEHGRAFLGDGIEVKKKVDIPMGATWSVRIPSYTAASGDADIRESASVAHLYGKDVVAAEAFTAFGYSTVYPPYSLAPRDLKPVADRMMAMGLNQFVIHTSVHQPDSRLGPGLGLGPYGIWFTRKETWAEQSKAWLDYLARSSYLLQQGRFMADIAYLYGQDTNVTQLFNEKAPPVPAGYNFDFVNTDALLHEMSARDGKLVTRGGAEYGVLALDPSTARMTLPVLRKLRELVQAGAKIVGAKPLMTPTLTDDESEFHRIVAELWNIRDSNTTAQRIVDVPLADALRAWGIAPDVIAPPTPEPLMFVHRALEGGDIYYLSANSTQPQNLEISFRLAGRKPELWRADSARIEPVSYRVEQGRTLVPLKLEAHDAVFVVFRQLTAASAAVVPELRSELLTALAGAWEVSFPSHRGAPARQRFDTLSSWTEHAENGIKYFSGTASYVKTFNVHKEWLQGRPQLLLDLGEVKNLAEVLVNGRSLGIAWKPPFKLDITDAVKVGANHLEVRVTNLWPNRLIGDKQPGMEKIAFAVFDSYKADSQLLPSGLLGPVVLHRIAAP